MRSALLGGCIIGGLAVAPASAVGDATYTLATLRAMAGPAASPGERFMAVYMASPERSAMLERLREKHPALVR
jgi:hypothetical protein